MENLFINTLYYLFNLPTDCATHVEGLRTNHGPQWATEYSQTVRTSRPPRQDSGGRQFFKPQARHRWDTQQQQHNPGERSNNSSGSKPWRLKLTLGVGLSLILSLGIVGANLVLWEFFKCSHSPALRKNNYLGGVAQTI